MSWASKRETTRTEDAAYSLLGIFGINMPLLYGEGPNAFLRLQQEIMKHSDDQTLLAWSFHEDDPEESGVLATSPAAFSKCEDFIPCNVGTPTPPFQITNKGLRIDMPISSDGFTYGTYGLLQCSIKQYPTRMIAIPLKSGPNGLYVRCKKPLCNLNYRYWSEWELTSVNLLPSFSFVSSITEPRSYTVFLRDLPETFYIAEVYPPNSRPQPDPRIVMTGSPESEDAFEAIAMILLKSSTSDVDPFVVKIIVKLTPGKSDFVASCTFVKNFTPRQPDPGHLEGDFYDNISLASLWRSHRYSRSLDWTTRRDDDYFIRCCCQHYFGKTLVLASVEKRGIEVEGVAPQGGPGMIFHEWDDESSIWMAENSWPQLRKGWAKVLKRLSYHFRNSLRTVVRSLALSPWIFAFVVDRLIVRIFKQLGRTIQHFREYLDVYAIGGGTALFLSYNRVLAQPISWQIRKILLATPFARQFGRLQRTDVLDFFVLYLCCHIFPSSFLLAALEKDFKVMMSILLGCGFCQVWSDNGFQYNYCLASADGNIPLRRK
ncbi:hypothetical protein FGADI_759 [Fusarium gaditjirri]|uniref:DUF8212 domain-containing protein n=1 Tax=Fusarium gaditjirri TaxID=282569 RepID=A0A8H4X436_9HYPO|nr:hypothetical protein FGADI_759 [Fusarium gaditjirri]